MANIERYAYAKETADGTWECRIAEIGRSTVSVGEFSSIGEARDYAMSRGVKPENWCDN